MKISVATSFAILFALILTSGLSGQNQEEIYPVDPATIHSEKVPQGELVKRKFSTSKIFPGTERDYAIYIPTVSYTHLTLPTNREV